MTTDPTYELLFEDDDCGLKLVVCNEDKLNVLDFQDKQLITLFKETNEYEIHDLETLECEFNDNLTSFSRLPHGLKNLSCSHNPKLTHLPDPLPDTLESLHCHSNKSFENFPTLPDTLCQLYCHNNQLVAHLPTLPETLRVLYCNDTGITHLPQLLHTDLHYLDCRNIYQMRNLPTLPDTLTHLYCCNTPLQELPNIPNSLQEIVVTFDQVELFTNHIIKNTEIIVEDCKFRPSLSDVKKYDELWNALIKNTSNQNTFVMNAREANKIKKQI